MAINLALSIVGFAHKSSASTPKEKTIDFPTKQYRRQNLLALDEQEN